MKDLIQVMAQSLVDNPENVVVSELKGNHCAVVELKVHKSEIGKVVGKGGRMAEALRTIVGAVSSKLKKPTVLEILETDEPCRPFSKPVPIRRQERSMVTFATVLYKRKRTEI